MKNFIQNGDSIQVTAPAGGIVGGTPYKIAGIVGVAVHDAEEGALCTIRVTGVYELNKGAVAINTGDALYWDDTAKVVNKTASGNNFIGYAWSTAVSGDATVYVKLFHD